MKDQFDVWRFNFPDKGGEHPVVLISHPDICARAAVVKWSGKLAAWLKVAGR